MSDRILTPLPSPILLFDTDEHLVLYDETRRVAYDVTARAEDHSFREDAQLAREGDLEAPTVEDFDANADHPVIDDGPLGGIVTLTPMSEAAKAYAL